MSECVLKTLACRGLRVGPSKSEPAYGEPNPQFLEQMVSGLKGPSSTARVFGEGVRSARGETAILGRGDHTRNTFGTSLHTILCKQTIALETQQK